MIIKEINNKNEYDQGLAKIAQENRSFLQSYEYGQLQASLGHKPFYLGLYDGNKIAGALLFILFKAKRGTYLFCPYGVHDTEQMEILIPYLRDLAKQEKVDFIRLSPLMDDDENCNKLFKKFGFRDAPVHMMHPELDWSLNINKEFKEILKGMRKNNRQGIKKAQQMGVEIRIGRNQEMMDTFYAMHAETAKRQGFTPWSKAFLDEQLKQFAPLDQIQIYLGYHEGKAIAGAVIMFYEGTAYYHHGASLSEYNKIPASYLIQWKAIEDAKARGFSRYSFYGIVEDAPKHPWAGLSFFKKGFGGQARKIKHCQDLALGIRYYLNYLIETVRRIKRGY